MTYPACLDTNPDLTGRGRRQFPIHHFQAAGLTRIGARVGDAGKVERVGAKIDGAVIILLDLADIKPPSSREVDPPLGSGISLSNGGRLFIGSFSSVSSMLVDKPPCHVGTKL